MSTVECGKCRAINNYPEGKIHELSCGQCGGFFWRERIKAIFKNWTRPSDWLPFIGFLVMVCLSFWTRLWPAAPVGVVLALLAWALRPSPKLIAQSIRDTLLPLTFGIFVFCLAAAAIGTVGGDQVALAVRWETSVINFGHWLEPIADPKSMVLWFGLGALLIGAGILRCWGLAQKALKAHKKVGFVYLAVAACLSFSMFSAKPITNAANTMVMEQRTAYIQAEWNFEHWAERRRHYDLLALGLKEAIKRHTPARSDLTNLAASVRTERSFPRIQDRANEWVAKRFPTNLESRREPADRRFILPYVELARRPDVVRQASSNPIFAEDGARSRGRLPNISEWRNAKFVTGRLASEAAELKNAATKVRTESIRMIISDVIETGVDRAGLMPTRELANQLSKRLVETIVDPIPVEQIQDRFGRVAVNANDLIERRVGNWISAARRDFPERRRAPTSPGEPPQPRTTLSLPELVYKMQIEKAEGGVISEETFKRRLEKNKRDPLNFCPVYGIPRTMCPQCVARK